MSYDLVVFDPIVAPQDREKFVHWYRRTATWEDSRDDTVPGRCSPSLKSWFLEMIEIHPALNGPYAKPLGLTEDPLEADYCMADHLIYVAFSASKPAAYQTSFTLAAKHAVGLFAVSEPSGEVWFPDGNGGLALAHKSAESDSQSDVGAIKVGEVVSLLMQQLSGGQR